MPPKKAANTTKAKVPAAKAAATGKVKKNAAVPTATSTAKAAPKRKTSTSEPAVKQTKNVAPKGASKASSSTKKKAPAPAAKPAAKPAATKASASNKAGPAAKPTANESKKRKTAAAEDAADGSVEAAPPAKKARVAAPKAPKVAKKGPVINQASKQRLHVYVFGEGSSGELGLGTAKNAIDVKRPRLNPHLAANTVGVVQIAAGGMHVAALTHDNKILTWGVNDQGALGRDTTWEGGLKDMDADDSDSDVGSDSGLNPKESTPTAIPSDSFPEGTVFVQVAAGDSMTFALTDEGLVYGWGTFRVRLFYRLLNCIEILTSK